MLSRTQGANLKPPSPQSLELQLAILVLRYLLYSGKNSN